MKGIDIEDARADMVSQYNCLCRPGLCGRLMGIEHNQVCRDGRARPQRGDFAPITASDLSQLVALTKTATSMDKDMIALAVGLLCIASHAMPETFFRNDSRCVLARKVLRRYGHDPEEFGAIEF